MGIRAQYVPHTVLWHATEVCLASWILKIRLQSSQWNSDPGLGQFSHLLCALESFISEIEAVIQLHTQSSCEAKWAKASGAPSPVSGISQAPSATIHLLGSMTSSTIGTHWHFPLRILVRMFAVPGNETKQDKLNLDAFDELWRVQ